MQVLAVAGGLKCGVFASSTAKEGIRNHYWKPISYEGVCAREHFASVSPSYSFRQEIHHNPAGRARESSAVTLKLLRILLSNERFYRYVLHGSRSISMRGKVLNRSFSSFSGEFDEAEQLSDRIFNRSEVFVLRGWVSHFPFWQHTGEHCRCGE